MICCFIPEQFLWVLLHLKIFIRKIFIDVYSNISRDLRVPPHQIFLTKVYSNQIAGTYVSQILQNCDVLIRQKWWSVTSAQPCLSFNNNPRIKLFLPNSFSWSEVSSNCITRPTIPIWNFEVDNTTVVPLDPLSTKFLSPKEVHEINWTRISKLS